MGEFPATAAPQPFLFTNPHGALMCPRCGKDYVHLDDVFVAGRPREDSEVRPVRVDAGGRTYESAEVDLPIPEVGRRHTFALKGWCEMCAGHFTIEFQQHKGQTMVSVREPSWQPLTPKAGPDQR